MRIVPHLGNTYTYIHHPSATLISWLCSSIEIPDRVHQSSRFPGCKPQQTLLDDGTIRGGAHAQVHEVGSFEASHLTWRRAGTRLRT